ncbi:uncharacterized protein LOC127290252 [Leptopilina boulardi]|uniref:uncharacterized protein LOC127290252 n=1 Tax=Leptopilina boulardi TaxID=63433 RepID=UPI0021F547AA|nr:uncharacterized protein LOC127290252 [Leptopilina boulardi]
MTSYKSVKYRALKRLLKKDSSDEFEPPDKLMNLSLSGSTSDFVSSESACSTMDNNLIPQYESDRNMGKVCLSENLPLPEKSDSPPVPSAVDVDNFVLPIVASQSDDSLSAYDSDEMKEAEKNFAENCKLDQNGQNDAEEPETLR